MGYGVNWLLITHRGGLASTVFAHWVSTNKVY